jgi:1-deoxy-D-xylulose-5-phosphate synthase
VLVTVEEGAAGGLGSLVMQHLAWHGLLDRGLKFRPMTLPDRLIDRYSQPRQYEKAGLNAPQIVAAVPSALDRREARRKLTLASTS